MINTTDGFKTAIFSGRPVRLKLDFGGGNVLEGDDIAKATFCEAAMTEDALTIGSCPAASLEFEAANKGGALSDWPWGRFEAWAGVEVSGEIEYARLGVFYAAQPEQSHALTISVSAYDKMAALDVDASGWWNGLVWPKTIGEVFAAFCTQFGLTAAGSTFLNSTVSIPARPVEATAVTAREVLRWIAEAAGSFARFDREGRLELAWFAAANAEVGDGRCFEREVAEYGVPAVGKLVVQGAEDDVGVTVGTGSNAYQIMDNPLLYGLTEAEIEGKAQPIYDRLAAFAAYTPITARCVGDWSIQAGDIVTFKAGGSEFSLPVFMQTVEFNGAAVATYECHGSAERRKAETSEKRETLATRRLIHTLKNTLEELSSTFEETTNTLTELENTVTTHTTQIAQNAAQILLKAAKTVVDTLTGRVETAEASITAQAGAIALKASQATVDAIGNRVGSAESAITVNANAISSKVSKNGVISSINQTAEQMKISASKLTLDGLVTATNLQNGTTTINGACIKTGTIDANRITVPNIDASKIISGTIDAERINGNVFVGCQYKTAPGYNGLWIDSNGVNFLTVPTGASIAANAIYSRIDFDGSTTTWKATNAATIDIGKPFTGSAGAALRVVVNNATPTLYLPYLGSQSGGNFLTIGANGVIGRGSASGGGTGGYTGNLYLLKSDNTPMVVGVENGIITAVTEF